MRATTTNGWRPSSHERNRQHEVKKKARQQERANRIARSCFHGALRWRLHLTRGDYSSTELLEAHLAQIDAHDDRINALVWQDRDRARKLAAGSQAKPNAAQPLAGFSMTIKESFNVSGAPTTWGIPAFRDNVASSNAVVVERMQAAGAIVFGKTNVPINLADFQSYNDIYGQTKNPWDLRRSPGGSSGGSAAALASGFDLELMMDVLAGPDALDKGVRYELKGLPYRDLATLRLAVWAIDDICPVTRETQAHVLKVADALAQSGAVVNYEARPKIRSQRSHDVYCALLWSVMVSGLQDSEYADMQMAAAKIPAGANDPADRLCLTGRPGA